ncbi:M48 family metalloprotease [Rhodovulum sp. DZ06]|uniref:M48 family metalloprotease n=1 Tax=Rhodovulum sp. DZ06 TaxID=3425126 RepID=UPI003D34731C
MRPLPGRRALAAALSFAVAAASAAPAAALSLIRDAEIETTLRTLSGPIFQAAGLRPEAVNIYLVNDGAPNAFVFGGRQLVITTGLIQDMDGPDELLGVIAHEAGHMTGGHLARRAIAARNLQGPALVASILGVAAAAAAGSGEAALAGGLGPQEAARRALLAHSRSEEAAADQAALTYLETAGVDPAGMLKVLDRFRGQEIFSAAQRDPYVSTHPISSSRLAFTQRRAAESPAAGKAPDPEFVYAFARMKAKLDGFLDHPASVLNDVGGPEGLDEFDLLRRAVALHRLPDPRGAQATVDRLIALHPDDAYYHELKGQFLLESGEGPDAVAAYREAARLAPDQPLIRAQLGRALLTREGEAAAREAVALLETGAREADGGDPSVLRDLAFAYARAGEEGKAALATAERLALVGARHDAVIQARRAKSLLPEGSPEWLRADDITASLGPRD